MKVLAIIVTFGLVLSAYSQSSNLRLKENNGLQFGKQFPAYELKTLKDSNSSTQNTPVKGSRKSPGLAFIYSLLVPGLGHVYADKFETGKYFMISEAALWIMYAGFSIYGNWLLDDAYNFSTTHAGVDLSGKERDAKFFTDIANFNNVYDYNNNKLRFGQYDELYDPQAGYYFYWDSDVNRDKYRLDKIAGDRTLNDRLFVVGAVVINHIISAISAVFAVNTHNSEIGKSGGLSFNTSVQKHFNRIDGISLKMIKWF